MLGKLLKLEFKATARLFLLIYAGMILFSVLELGVSILSKKVFPGTISSTLYMFMTALFVIALAAGFIAASIFVIVRFYKNMLGDEGYLMMTLPVKTSQHIISKLIVSSLWSILTVGVIFLSIVIALLGSNIKTIIGPVLQQLRLLGFDPGTYLGFLLGIIIISTISGMLLWYAAISFGPHVMRNRLGGTVIAYLIIYFAYQILTTLVLFAIYGAQAKNYIQNDFSWIDPNFNTLLISTFIGVFISSCISGIVTYIITHRMLDKKLNLN